MYNEKVWFSMPSLRMNIKKVFINACGEYMGIHIHKEIELVYVEKGTLLCEVNDEKRYIKEGETLLINRCVMHRLLYGGEEAVCTYIQIDIDMYSKELMCNSDTYLSLFTSNDLVKRYEIFDGKSEPADIFLKINNEATLQQRSFEEYIKANIFHLVAFMRRSGFLAASGVITNNENIARLMPAIRFIDENFASRLTLDEISKTININKYYFCKLFKSVTGATFIEYVNFIRLYNAENLLLDSRSNISEIAFESGFSSVQHFNKLFKKFKGCTPKEYRKMCTS